MITTDAGPHNTTGRAAEAAAPRLEAVISQALPTQHPAVVFRSHYLQLRALLAVAVIAVVSLTPLSWSSPSTTTVEPAPAPLHR